MDNKITIFCDIKWYENYKFKDDLKLFNIIPINKKISTFTYTILKEIVNRDNETIIIICDKFDGPSDIIKKLYLQTFDNIINIYSKNLNSFDFTEMINDTIISFNSNAINKNNTNRIFSTLLDLQKYIVTKITNTKKYLCNVLNHKGEYRNVITEEELIIKNVSNKKIKQMKFKKSSNKVKKRKNEIIVADFTNLKNPTKKSPNKPKILFVSDVKGWAWWNKTKTLKKYLDNYYDIDLISVIDTRTPVIDYRKYDLYFTYGYSYVNRISKAEFNRRISGVTAHRPLEVLSPKLNKVAWSHANSVLLYKMVKKIHPNVFYVPNGVDPKKFKYIKTEPKENIIFGHVGKESPRKGQKRFIEPACNKSKVIYFSHYNNYKTRISHDKMPEIYKNFDVFICASEEDGTPCPALEAAASGIPIISNKIGNMPELIENYKTGILLEKRDVDLYIDAIKWCKDNPDKVFEMGKNIREKIENEWSWKLMAKNYLYMFDSILNIKRDVEEYENPARYHIKEN